MGPRAGVRLGGYACAWLCAHRGKGRGERGQLERGVGSGMEPHILTDRIDILAPINAVFDQCRLGMGPPEVFTTGDDLGRVSLFQPDAIPRGEDNDANDNGYTLIYGGRGLQPRRSNIILLLTMELTPFTVVELAAVKQQLHVTLATATHVTVTCSRRYAPFYYKLLTWLGNLSKHYQTELQAQAQVFTPVMLAPRRGRPAGWLGALVRDLVRAEEENTAIYALVRQVAPAIEEVLPPDRNPDGSIVGGTLDDRIGDAITRARRGAGTPLNSEPN